jgi:hypothetical protein
LKCIEALIVSYEAFKISSFGIILADIIVLKAAKITIVTKIKLFVKYIFIRNCANVSISKGF